MNQIPCLDTAGEAALKLVQLFIDFLNSSPPTPQTGPLALLRKLWDLPVSRLEYCWVFCQPL